MGGLEWRVEVGMVVFWGGEGGGEGEGGGNGG